MKVKWQFWPIASLQVSMWPIRGHRTFDSATGWGFLTQTLLIATVIVLWPGALNIFHGKHQHIWNCAVSPLQGRSQLRMTSENTRIGYHNGSTPYPIGSMYWCMVYLPNLLYMDPKRVSMTPVTFQDFSGQSLAGVWREAGLFAWKPVQVPFLLWEGGGYSQDSWLWWVQAFFCLFPPLSRWESLQRALGKFLIPYYPIAQGVLGIYIYVYMTSQPMYPETLSLKGNTKQEHDHPQCSKISTSISSSSYKVPW